MRSQRTKRFLMLAALGAAVVLVVAALALKEPVSEALLLHRLNSSDRGVREDAATTIGRRGLKWWRKCDAALSREVIANGDGSAAVRDEIEPVHLMVFEFLFWRIPVVILPDALPSLLRPTGSARTTRCQREAPHGADDATSTPAHSGRAREPARDRGFPADERGGVSSRYSHAWRGPMSETRLQAA